MSLLDLENPEANGEIYDNWASSVKDRPELIDQKVRPSACMLLIHRVIV